MSGLDLYCSEIVSVLTTEAFSYLFLFVEVFMESIDDLLGKQEFMLYASQPGPSSRPQARMYIKFACIVMFFFINMLSVKLSMALSVQCDSHQPIVT
jgi:hypothetical protein